MDSVLTSSVVDYGFESSSGQTKDYKIVIFSFSAHSKDKGVREKTGWREIKIMYSSGETVGMLFHWDKLIQLIINVLV